MSYSNGQWLDELTCIGSSGARHGVHLPVTPSTGLLIDCDPINIDHGNVCLIAQLVAKVICMPFVGHQWTLSSPSTTRRRAVCEARRAPKLC